MSKSMRYAPEVRERAVRLVQEAQKDHQSQWAAIQSIAEKIGVLIVDMSFPAGQSSLK